MIEAAQRFRARTTGWSKRCRRLAAAVVASALLAGLLAGCAGPLAFVPITPLLSAALSTRSEDSRTGELIAELQKKGDWAGIARFAQDRLLREPSNANWWVTLGYALLQQGQYHDATLALTRATQANPEDIDGWNLLAEAQRRAGQPGASARTLERAVSVDPTSQVTRYLMGEAYRENGDPLRAEAAYRQALQLAPDMALAWLGLGGVLIQTGTTDELDAITRNLQRLDTGLAAEFVRQRAAARR
jgi:cytochrome c-type biogenesis protein CcmH/NrfG